MLAVLAAADGHPHLLIRGAAEGVAHGREHLDFRTFTARNSGWRAKVGAVFREPEEPA